MKHVLVGLVLLSSSLAFGSEVARQESEIQGMTTQKQTCEEQVKALHAQIAELNEKIARAQSALEVKKVEVTQRVLPAPVTTTAATA